MADNYRVFGKLNGVTPIIIVIIVSTLEWANLKYLTPFFEQLSDFIKKKKKNFTVIFPGLNILMSARKQMCFLPEPQYKYAFN